MTPTRKPREVRPAEGRVALVGAGPGDPELLTIKALRALERADVILHDDLVGDGVLGYANPKARIVAVGKRGGCPSTSQAFIEQLMVREARAGAFVVRLKGGDPFVFGRGGEEADALRAAGIDVEVIPGVTSGLAAATAIGVPVTHRAYAHGVALVTGHVAEGSERGPDWDVLAKSGLTLVIYMGVANAQQIRAKLLASGMAATTRVAVVAQATRPQQRVATSTLRDFVEVMRDSAVGGPAIIIVGDVAAFASGEVGVASRPDQTPAAIAATR
ncbi:MAG: uroporphyrinogen-III C-methyltransferase [Casimicrobiaceae bacterium]